MCPRVSLFLLPPAWLKLPHLSGVFLKSYLQTRFCGKITLYDINSLVPHAIGINQKSFLRLDRTFEENLFDTVQNRAPELWKKIVTIAASSDVIGFTLLGRNRSFTLSAVDVLRTRFPEKTFVIGGPEVRRMHALGVTLPEGQNLYWVVGEGEIPLARICAGKKDIRMSVQEEIADLDTIPFLDFSDYQLDSYQKKMLPLLSSRGCVQKCSFCSETFLYKKFRYHSPRYMADQIDALVRRWGIRSFSFQDSLLNYSLPWLEEFCGLILQRGLHISWEAQMRVHPGFSVALARLVKQSGCLNVFVGLESGSDAVLQAMHKGYTVQQASDFLTKLSDAGLHAEISLMVGFPAETDDDFKKTIAFVTGHRRLIGKIAQVNPYVSYVPSLLAPHGDIPVDQKVMRKRMRAFMQKINRHKIRHTEAFVNNLVYADYHR